MPSFAPGFPTCTEYAPAFAGYIARARDFAVPVDKLAAQRDELLTLLAPLPEAKQLHRYGPDKWSVKQVLGHMTDCERIFAYRALRIGRGDETPLPGFEENSYVIHAEADGCPWDSLLQEFRLVRDASILLAEHFPDSAWTRTGISNGAPISTRALIYVVIGHTAHHLDILRQRYL